VHDNGVYEREKGSSNTYVLPSLQLGGVLELNSKIKISVKRKLLETGRKTEERLCPKGNLNKNEETKIRTGMDYWGKKKRKRVGAVG